MKKIAEIGNLLKKTYRLYSNELVSLLQSKGHLDLRASFLEILIFVSENDNPSIKNIGDACGLKKQTMTSHLNELENRGYIIRKASQSDRRELKVHLTEYGETFKLTLMDVTSELENKYIAKMGEVELDRVEMVLSQYFIKMNEVDQQAMPL
jgi:DNA-binding MarR family transcriptional regulator